MLAHRHPLMPDKATQAGDFCAHLHVTKHAQQGQELNQSLFVLKFRPLTGAAVLQRLLSASSPSSTWERGLGLVTSASCPQRFGGPEDKRHAVLGSQAHHRLQQVRT